MDTEICNEHKCPQEIKSANTSNPCECGCVLTEVQGSLFAGASRSCWNQTLHWVVPGRYLAKLRLVFVDRLATDELMKVYSAGGEVSIVIFYVTKKYFFKRLKVRLKKLKHPIGYNVF